MAITFTARGNTASLEPLDGGRAIVQVNRVEVQEIVGRRGGVALPSTASDSIQRVRIRGALIGSSASDLASKWDTLTTVLDSGRVHVTDENGRVGVIVKDTLSWQDRAPFVRYVTIGAYLLDGAWRDSLSSVHIVTTTINELGGTSPAVRYLVIDYDGTAPSAPILRLLPQTSAWSYPLVTWKGRNLIPNSGLDEGTGSPTGWLFYNATPSAILTVEHMGRVGRRALMQTNDGTHRYFATDRIPVSGNVQYTASGYARSDGGYTGRVFIYWYDASSSLISSVSSASIGTSSDWTRISVTATSPANAVTARISVGWIASGQTIYWTDFQLEEGATATEFVNTSWPEHRHVTISRTSALDPASNEAWLLDCDRGIAKLWTNTGSGTWTDDGADTSGGWFRLLPGRNHIYIDPAAAGATVAVTASYVRRYY